MKDQCFYRVGIKGIVIDDQGRVLLTREDNGRWEMLGGGLNHEEDVFDCLRREVAEEAGLEVVSIAPKPSYFITTSRVTESTYKDTYMANVVYEIRLKDLDFTPSDECQELRFFTNEEMETADLFPNVRKLLALRKAEQSA